MEKKKVFIIDTNVILFDPHALYKFAEHDVVLPLVVIEEVDKFKRDQSENGRNARTFSRLIDELRAKSCAEGDGPRIRAALLGGPYLLGIGRDKDRSRNHRGCDQKGEGLASEW